MMLTYEQKFILEATQLMIAEPLDYYSLPPFIRKAIKNIKDYKGIDYDISWYLNKIFLNQLEKGGENERSD